MLAKSSSRSSLVEAAAAALAAVLLVPAATAQAAGVGAPPTGTVHAPSLERGRVTTSGQLIAWHPLTLSFTGPPSAETAVPNPFLDYRLVVEFLGPSGQLAIVPGFYDGDGRGGGSGAIWRVRFAPNEGGRWRWRAHFDAGKEIAVSLDASAGRPVGFDGLTGSVRIAPRDPRAPGFYRWGKLLWQGGHYLKFVDGPWFIKTGTNSAENLLGYAGFDNTKDHGGLSTGVLPGGLHRYDLHVRDFGPAGLGTSQDPFFRSAESGLDSRGIVGALNYLSSVGVNAIYFLPMNLGGDGWETCPFIGYANDRWDKTRYDVSKLTQWNEVFEHAQRRGLLLHFVLGETEWGNERWLDDGRLGVERKLFYREMVARFGHALAIKWNIGEECDFSNDRIREFAQFIRTIDPYGHPTTFHTYALPPDGASSQLAAMLGDGRIVSSSLQVFPYAAGDIVERWRDESASAGLPWIVEIDEQTLGLTDTNATELRKKMLYDVLFSGGGLEWYAGYHPLPLGGDLRLENFRTREEMWNYTRHARTFLEGAVPFWLMEPADHLVTGESQAYGGAEVLALPGHSYAIYLPSASSTGKLDLTGATGIFEQRWYDPRTGAIRGSLRTLRGGAPRSLSSPPFKAGEDWVVLVQRR